MFAREIFMKSILDQLRDMTVVVSDTGEVEAVKKISAGGLYD